MEREDKHNSSSEEEDHSQEASEEEEEDDAFDASSEENNEYPELGMQRMTSKQIGRDYSYQIIDPEKVFSMIQTSIVAVKNAFEYLNLDEGFILTALRENGFLVDATIERLQDKAMSLMGREKSKEIQDHGEMVCLIDFMPMESHQGKDIGCGHLVCNECWKSYIEQKVAEGLACINTKCPVFGCKKGVPISFFEEYATRDTFNMYDISFIIEKKL